MRRPLLEAAAGLAAGLLVASIVPWPAARAGLALLALLTTFLPRGRRRVFPVLAAVALGLARAAPSDGPTGNDVAARLGPEPALVKLRGVVVSDAEPTRSGLQVMDLDARRLSGRPASGRVRLLLTDAVPVPAPGDEVEALGMLRRPGPARNPGERPRIDGRPTLLVDGAGRLRVLSSPAIPGPRRLVAALRRAAAGRLRRSLPEAEAGIAAGLLLGRRADIPAETEESFRRSGTVHLLAVSGLHVGLVVGGVYLLMGIVRVPPRARGLAAVGFAVLYAGLAGLRPPVVRAALLVALGSGALLLRRRTTAMDLLGATAFLVLLLRPEHARRIDFQLSFTAVLGLILLTPRIARALFPRRDIESRFAAWHRVSRIRRILRSHVHTVLPASMAAWIVTSPLVLHHLGILAPIAVAGNLLLLPLLVPAIASAALALAIGPAGPLVTAALALPIRALCAAAELLAGVPGAAMEVSPPSLAAMLTAYAVLGLLALRPVWRRRHLGAAVAVPAVLLLSVLPRTPPERDRLTVLDVGHGTSILLERHDGGVLLYDAGSMIPAVARRRIGPALLSRRIRRLDVLVLSHADADHVSGAAHLLRRFSVARLVVPATFTRSALGREILELARRRDVPVRVVSAGDSLAPFGRILHPPPVTSLGDNDGSIVLRASLGPHRVLLTGDIEETGIEILLASGSDLETDALLLPHHGARNGRLPDLIEAASPRILLVSTSRRIPRNRPLPSLPTHVTALEGALTVQAGGENLRIVPVLPARPGQVVPPGIR